MQYKKLDIKRSEEIKEEINAVEELNKGKEVKAVDLMRSMGIEVVEN